MTVFSDHSLRVGGARIHYQVGGSRGAPLVLLHGLSGSSRWWARNVQALAERFRVHVVDLIGHGRSRGQRFVLSEAADLTAQMLDALDLPRASIIGHSMGGFVAAGLAARHPGRIDRLVLVDALTAPIGRSLARSAVGLANELPYLPYDFLPVLLRDALRAGPRTLLRSILDLHRPGLPADLGQVEARTLIVWGEHDRLLPPTLGEALRRALPLAEYAVIPRAGHVPMWHRPEIFNQTVIAFLEKQAAE